jgi:hypothetical protein
MSARHPEDGEWMEWLYGECDDARSQELQSHLSSCHLCSGQVKQWQRVLTVLNDSPPDCDFEAMATRQLSRVTPVSERQRVGVMVLVASICIAAVGGAFASSVFASPAIDEDLLRTRVTQQMRIELQDLVRDELVFRSSDEQRLLPLIHDESGRVAAATLAGWAEQDSVRREQLQQVLRNVLQNQITLRQDLETLAMEAEAQILRTRREIIRVNVDPNRNEGRYQLPPSGRGLPDRADVERY